LPQAAFGRRSLLRCAKWRADARLRRFGADDAID
jgi:hypothetical protein